MSAFFAFELFQVSLLLRGLRLLREAEPNNKDIDGTICWIKQQMVGKIKRLEPFMRNRTWIEDEITGGFHSAVLRWRLDPGLTWTLTDCGCRSSAMELRVRAPQEGAIERIKLAQGWESLYYLQETPLSVLEVHLAPHCRSVVTEAELLD